ncbi:hypothetical protein BX667DRAFT_363708 [Coemansia mojavensis]|nr:hypothetical protein BX667DRAFT_363708 [Coemansia mojavensis]
MFIRYVLLNATVFLVSSNNSTVPPHSYITFLYSTYIKMEPTVSKNTSKQTPVLQLTKRTTQNSDVAMQYVSVPVDAEAPENVHTTHFNWWQNVLAGIGLLVWIAHITCALYVAAYLSS